MFSENTKDPTVSTEPPTHGPHWRSPKNTLKKSKKDCRCIVSNLVKVKTFQIFKIGTEDQHVAGRGPFWGLRLIRSRSSPSHNTSRADFATMSLIELSPKKQICGATVISFAKTTHRFCQQASRTRASHFEPWLEGDFFPLTQTSCFEKKLHPTNSQPN